MRLLLPCVCPQDSEKSLICFQVRSHKVRDVSEKAKVGFMIDPKRFNVAVTRAQALLIVIGDPRLLNQVTVF